ncbi:MAG: hypothetical protein HYU67_13035 [Flavobacteriia bacterium]|nr:hypothetical protein [Flavobacteriia bacterium]
MAEKYFLKDSVLQCFSTYNDVFSHNELLFPRDCFMAAQIAHSVDNDSLAIEYLLKGISFGLNPDFFSIDTFETNASKLKDLKNCRFWTKVIYKKDSLMKIYRNKVDWKLKKELMSLIRTDQNWRRKNNKWFNRNFRPGLEKKFNIFNQKCMLYLDSVFNSVGYPGNWLIGTGDSLAYQTKYASFNNANLGDLVSVLLYHNDSAFINYGDFLLKEIDNGHIHPRVYALIRDFRDRHLDKKDKEEIMYYNIWWERGNLSVDEIENHCNEIGCPTKQHLRDLSNKLGKGYDVFWSPFR